MSIPPVTPMVVFLFVVFGVPIVVLSSYFVHMCGVLKRQDKAKEDSNAR